MPNLGPIETPRRTSGKGYQEVAGNWNKNVTLRRHIFVIRASRKAKHSGKTYEEVVRVTRTLFGKRGKIPLYWRTFS